MSVCQTGIETIGQHLQGTFGAISKFEERIDLLTCLQHIADSCTQLFAASDANDMSSFETIAQTAIEVLSSFLDKEVHKQVYTSFNVLADAFICWRGFFRYEVVRLKQLRVGYCS